MKRSRARDLSHTPYVGFEDVRVFNDMQNSCLLKCCINLGFNVSNALSPPLLRTASEETLAAGFTELMLLSSSVENTKIMN